MTPIFKKRTTRRKQACMAQDERGSTIIEMAVILPCFLMLLMGVFDIGYAAYTRAMLQGSVEEAGRNATLEAFNLSQSALDNDIRAQMATVNQEASANLTFDRRNYRNFADVNTPEDFIDGNGNGTRDPGECFVDKNGDGMWNVDEGVSGNGGAEDVVLYTATTTYNRLFPLWKMLGEPQQVTMTAQTILRNQPFSAQGGRGGAQICT